MLGFWPSFYHNHLTSPKSPSKVSKNKKKKLKDTSNVKVLNNDSRKKLLFFIKSLVGIVISIVAFYMVPWEKYLFTDEELVEIFAQYDMDNYNFIATAEQHFKDVYLREYPCNEKGYWREKQMNRTLGRCGTIITDELLPKNQVFELQILINKLIDTFGDTSYANRESLNLQWLNFHNLFRRNVVKKRVLTKRDYQLLKNLTIAAKQTVSQSFGIPHDYLHFTMVTQMTRYRPIVKFQEFRHVDKVRSVGCIVTSIFWLSTHNVDFAGGLLEFLNGPGPEPFDPVFIEPKLGRFSAWSSGYESPHGVSEVYWGSRVAIIMAFTVNPKLGFYTIDDLRKFAANTSNALNY